MSGTHPVDRAHNDRHALSGYVRSWNIISWDVRSQGYFLCRILTCFILNLLLEKKIALSAMYQTAWNTNYGRWREDTLEVVENTQAREDDTLSLKRCLQSLLFVNSAE